MTAKKKKKHLEDSHSALENPEVLQEGISRFEKVAGEHKQLFLSIFTIVVLVITGFMFYRYYVAKQDDIAQSEMFQAVYYYEADSLNLALNGDGNNLGFLDIIDDYGFTDAANLAHFYAGSAYLKSGNFIQAIAYLENFDSDDLVLQARSYSLIGDAYMEIGEYKNAADNYSKAASYKPNKYFTPEYLMKAALAYEKLSDLQKAKDMYDKIVEDFWDSNQVQEAKKQSARLQGLIKG